MLILVTLLLLGTIYGQNYDGFLMNKGQWDDQAILRKEVADGFFWVDKNGFTVEQLDHSIMHDLHLAEEKAEKKASSTSAARMLASAES